MFNIVAWVVRNWSRIFSKKYYFIFVVEVWGIIVRKVKYRYLLFLFVFRFLYYEIVLIYVLVDKNLSRWGYSLVIMFD